MRKKHAGGRGLKQALLVLLLAAVGTCAACAGGSGQALAADTHVFNAALSLTGGCTSSEIDPIPDPGCPEGAHPPSGPFSGPRSVTTDQYGDIFVAGFGSSIEKGRVDVFSSSGLYLDEVAVPEGPLSMAIDSECHLYVFTTEGTAERYDSSTCEPGKLEYGATPTLVAKGFAGAFMALAVDRKNDHLFVHFGAKVVEYSSAAEGNKEIGTIGGGFLFNNNGIGLAVDAAHGRIYTSDQGATPQESVIRVFELASPHKLIETIDGSTTPEGRFRGNSLSIAVDEATGHVFAYDGNGANVAYEFTEDGAYISTIEHEFRYVPGAEIAIDNGAESPNGALNPDGRFLFVPSHPTGIGHSFAFGPAPKECPPEIEAPGFSEVTEADAQLEAKINPCNLETSYTFEYTTRQRFEEEGFAGAIVAGEGQIPAGEAPVKVSAPATGLSPETTYRFRLIATNSAGEDAGEAELTTYPVESSPPSCPNDPLRTGLSALLPDCRAYELVTPGDTNGRTPQGVDHLGVYFATREASPAGDKVSFEIEGGLVPGSEGTGSYGGDPYLSTRGEAGWTTSIAGPSGEETSALLPGSTSPDQGYSFWSTGGGEGTAGGTPNHEIAYVHYPDGHSALVGRGSLADDPEAEGKLISENGSHIIFVSHSFNGFGFFHPAVPLEENSPPEGTGAIYDRTADEVTHVVSLLPGNVTPAAGENAFYEGASLDGEGVAFRLGGAIPAGPLYFRYHDAETFEFGEEATFAGFSEGAKRIFYLEGGDLFAFDVESEETIRFSESGDATVVNLAAGGTSAYFVSPSVLTGEANPNGAIPEAGKENLYRSQEGAISFVGVLLEHDVVGDPERPALDMWVPHVVNFGEAGEDPSRTTPDGTVIVFESRASLTGYDSEGHVEVYRYDSAAGELTCLSCNPTQAPASGNASLQSVAQAKGEPEPFGPFAMVNNLSLDGRRAFFQSPEALVAGDTDRLQDVYEWEAQGVGTCSRPGGCVYLISSGNSARVDYLYAVSDSGDDVFFRTSDRLLPADSEGAPSIYDARVGGGFPEPAAEECQGEGCRPGLPGPPALPVPQTAPSGATNVTPHHCRKGARKVTRRGKTRCVKKHRRHRKAGSQKKGAGK
jgi:hypothetical protein